MKTLKIPKVQYNFYDSSLIKKTLDSYQTSRDKNGLSKRTLYGVYKLIRQMSLFAGLGDFVILSSCVKWLRAINQSPTLTEIRRTMLYFNPPIPTSYRRQLANTFLDMNTMGLRKTVEAKKTTKNRFYTKEVSDIVSKAKTLSRNENRQKNR